MVCRELQPASELSAVNVAVKYHDRCIEGEGGLPTLATKIRKGRYFANRPVNMLFAGAKAQGKQPLKYGRGRRK